MANYKLNYTGEKINNLLFKIDNLPEGVSTFKFEVVEELPTQNIDSSTIYLKQIETEGDDRYEEWICLNGIWELLGTTAVDLTGYATEEYVNNSIINKANTSDVLTKTNTTTFTPSADYHPATKKYVDEKLTGSDKITYNAPSSSANLSFSSLNPKAGSVIRCTILYSLGDTWGSQVALNTTNSSTKNNYEIQYLNDNKAFANTNGAVYGGHFYLDYEDLFRYADFVASEFFIYITSSSKTKIVGHTMSEQAQATFSASDTTASIPTGLSLAFSNKATLYSVTFEKMS